MSDDTTDSELVIIDATAFQEPLGKLAETIAQKVKREGLIRLPAPQYVADDIHVMIRHTLTIYKLFMYLNADKHRESDPFLQDIYSVATTPLVRSMIDSLYNIIAILQDPPRQGRLFRESGVRNRQKTMDAEKKRYSGRSEEWDQYLKERQETFDLLVRRSGVSITDGPEWPTLGKYIKLRKGEDELPEHRAFLKTFLYGSWRDYSALAHSAFEGLLGVGVFYVIDSQPHEDRPKIEALYPRFRFQHITRVCAVLLCIITELQAHCRFEGANINERICKIWKALIPVLEVKELYDERYARLMERRGIGEL